MYNGGLFSELKLYGAEINIQIIIDTCFDGISKGVLFRITGIKIVNQNQVLDWVDNPVFANTGGTVFKQFAEIVHSPAAW